MIILVSSAQSLNFYIAISENLSVNNDFQYDPKMCLISDDAFQMIFSVNIINA